MDELAKSLGEFIRVRWVEVPTKFLGEGHDMMGGRKGDQKPRRSFFLRVSRRLMMICTRFKIHHEYIKKEWSVCSLSLSLCVCVYAGQLFAFATITPLHTHRQTVFSLLIKGEIFTTSLIQHNRPHSVTFRHGPVARLVLFRAGPPWGMDGWMDGFVSSHKTG
jgi:hypothetical protein